MPEDLILQTARSLAAEFGYRGHPGNGVWLLRGMGAGGVLTTVDPDGEHQRITRRIFAEALLCAVKSR